MLNWAYVPYTLPLLLCGALTLALGVYAGAHSRLQGARPFMWVCLAAAAWAITYAVYVDSAGLPAKIFWSKVEYIPITAGPLCWLAFALTYTRRVKRISRWSWALLSLIPIVTVGLVFTNEMHGLIWRAITLDSHGPFPVLQIEYGSWFWVHTATSYLYMTLGSVLMLRGLIGARQVYRRQRIALMVGVITPWVGNILYIAKLSPVPGLDLTPFAATLGAGAVAWALFAYRLLDLVPVARTAVMDSMSDGVIALDTGDRIVDWNQAAGRIIGITPTAAIGQPVGRVLHKHSDLVERFRDSTETQAEIVRGPPEEPRYYEVRIAVLRDEAGEYAGRLVTLHDITERKRAQEEIQTLNAELEARVLTRTAELAAANQAKDDTLRREQAARQDLAFLAEASRILAGSLDEAATLTSVAEHIVPYLADGCIIHALDDAGLFQRVAATHHDPRKAALIADIERSYPVPYAVPYGFPRVAHTGAHEFQPQVADGDLVDVARDAQHLALLRALDLCSYICVPLVGRERTLGAITLLRCHPSPGYTPSALLLAQDLAQRAALALDNAQLYRATQRAVQVRDEFLTVASHELKTPLTSLQLAVYTVLRSTREGGQPSVDYLTRRLTIVDDQSKRLAGLVNNLLDISRITAGRLQLEPQAVDLAALVRQGVEQFQEELALAHCPVTLDAATPVRGFWDRSRMEQVVTNLLTNAMKYGRGQPITISVAVEGPAARLSVRDEGIGIAPEHLERIFGRFERAVAPGKYSGMGMGLYITRQIVEAHGGRICVTSAPEQGATFTVTLPLAPG